LKSLYFFCCCVDFFCSCTFLLRCKTIKIRAEQTKKGKASKVLSLTFCLAECSATISEKSSSSSCRPRVCFRNCSSYFFSRPF
uniref:Secreted protein n=1 Tax=Brugia timori TaxID=42155 RepID=A0A0R3QS87_9BILA